MTARKVLGVDPGAKGGLAIVCASNLLSGTRMPTMSLKGKVLVDARAIVDWLEGQEFDHVVVEAVHAMPKQGVTSSFQFGRSLGAVEGVLATYGKPMHYVQPAQWKRALGLSSSKQQSIDLARTRFGRKADHLIRFKADDGIAEAALLAAYWDQL